MSRRFQLALLPAVLAAVLTAVPVSAAKTPVRLTEAAGQFPDRAFILTLPTARPLAASQVQVRENGQRVMRSRGDPGGRLRPEPVRRRARDRREQQHEGGSDRRCDPRGATVRRPPRPDPEGRSGDLQQRASRWLFRLRPTPERSCRRWPISRSSRTGHTSTTRWTRASRFFAVRTSPRARSWFSRTVATRAARRLSPESRRGARKAHIRVFAVGLRSHDFDPASLRGLAKGTSGSFSEATSANDLSRIYDQLGAELSHEYLLRYRSLQSLGAEGSGIGSGRRGSDGSAERLRDTDASATRLHRRTTERSATASGRRRSR